MYFAVSASIAAEYPELAAVISSLDEHLAHCGDQAIRAETASDFIGVDPEAAQRLLSAFARHGVLIADQECLCPACRQPLSPIRDGNDLWCDLCEGRFPAQAIAPSSVYRVSPDAARDEELATEPADREGDGTTAGSTHQRIFRRRNSFSKKQEFQSEPSLAS